MPMQDRKPVQPEVELILTQDSNKSFYNEYSFKTYISKEIEMEGSSDKQVTKQSERAISRKRWVY